MAYPTSLDELTDGVPSDGTAAATALGDAVYQHDDHHRALATAVEAVETELGTDPSGSEATVKARIAAVEALADAAQTAAEVSSAISAYAQPVDSDLTAIAALSTSAYGRAFLALADQAALVALLPSYQPLDSDLTSIAALTTTAYGRAVLELANQAALMGLLSASSESASGIVELATSAEVLTGTDTARAVTPAGAASVYLTRNLLPGSVADDTYTGATATLTAAENLAIGNVCYINSSSKLAKADADSASTAGALFIALATINQDASGSFGLPGGFLRDDSAYNWTPGATLYLDTNAGGLTATQPSGSGDIVQVLGVAYSADVVFFNPSPVVGEVA